MEMPVSCTSLALAGVVPIYSPWWVARLLQRATTLSLSAIMSSMVLSTSGKPLRENVLPGAWQPRVHRAHDGQDARGRDLGNAVIYGVGDEVDPYYAVGGGATDEEAPR